MFKKVLIVDDIDLNNVASSAALTSLGIEKIDNAKYCYDAIIKVQKAILDEEPYELVVSDLSFKNDYREDIINTGQELISKLKKLDENLKVIAFSIEDRSSVIKSLYKDIGIDGYVIKDRNSMECLKKAVKDVYENKIGHDIEVSHLLQENKVDEIDMFDISLLKNLASGIAQDQMEQRFKDLGIKPNSKSSIEKRISKLKDYFQANNTIHLIAITKDMGII